MKFVEENEKKNEQAYWEKRPMSRVAKVVVVVLVLIIAGIAVLLGSQYYRIAHNPAALFEATPMQSPTSEPTQAANVPTAAPTPTPTPNPYELLQQQADTSMMKDIVNIMLIGVDYAPERETWSGKHAYHSDVMIVLAVNFKENTLDMISLPRDTYAKIPGVEGIYKLNASIDCGGGYPGGLPKVAEAASWMLGGIPVDYYYAVTMPVVKELVDTIGGVEYDIDVSFKMMGRSYQKGPQLLDGQGVLDYFRVRKNVQDAGDVNRVVRQKNLLVAIFRKMQSENLLVTLPQLVKTFDGKLLTNTTLDQTAALALFAYNLPSEQIRMHSMGGSMRNIFNWAFCITNQDKRVELIKQVYGVEVEPYAEYSLNYCLRKWAQMRSKKFFSNAEAVLSAARSYVAPATPAAPEMPGVEPWVDESQSLAASIASVSAALSNARSQVSGGSGAQADEALSVLQRETTSLAGKIGYGSLGWGVSYKNEIDVDFR